MRPDSPNAIAKRAMRDLLQLRRESEARRPAVARGAAPDDRRRPVLQADHRGADPVGCPADRVPPFPAVPGAVDPPEIVVEEAPHETPPDWAP